MRCLDPPLPPLIRSLSASGSALLHAKEQAFSLATITPLRLLASGCQSSGQALRLYPCDVLPASATLDTQPFCLWLCLASRKRTSILARRYQAITPARLWPSNIRPSAAPLHCKTQYARRLASGYLLRPCAAPMRHSSRGRRLASGSALLLRTSQAHLARLCQ